MKLSKQRWGVALVALLLMLGIAAILLHKTYVYPTPETQSAFLQHYSPATVYAQFQCKARTSSLSIHEGGAAGDKSATHEKGFEDYFVIERGEWMPLMDSLAKDLADQLRVSGANVLDVAGDARDGFRLQYKSGNTVGSATIAPLEITDPGHPPQRLTQDQIPVHCKVDIHEEWFREKPGLITLKVSGEMR